MSYDYTLIGNTDDVALDPISAMVQSVLQAKSVLAASVMQGTWTPGSDSASYPRAAGFVAEAVPSTSDGLNAQTIDWAVDKLLFDQDYAVLVDMKDRARAHSSVDQFDAVQERQALAIVKQIEASVYTALAATSASAPDHRIAFATSGVINTSDILLAIQALDDQEVPEEDRILAINPKQYRQLLSLGDFVDASKYGSNDPIMNGEIGQIFGVKVLKTPRVTADTAILYHKEHVVFAMEKEMSFESQRDLGKVSTKLLMTARWGVKTLDSGKRGYLMNNAGS